MRKLIAALAFTLIPLAGYCVAPEDEAMLDTAYKTLQDVVMPHVQWKRSDIASVPKFGGYIVGSYKYDDMQGNHGGDGFNVRLVRLYVDGTVMKDFKYRLQLEVNATPHIKDAYVSWSHWKELEVKVGEFKRCFTFENPYHPMDVGMGDYAQLTKKFSGFGDRCGEGSMGGRDLGLQIQGDAFKSRRDGHSQFHYAVAVFNGQGINRRDADHRKDLMGTLQWSPVRDLWIGVFGWTGSWKSDAGVKVDRNRYGGGIKYEGRDNGWSARAEYIHSRGHKASDYVAASGTQPAYWAGGSKADAWYATVGIPVWRWIKVYAKYDAYRDYASKASMHTIYGASVNLQPHKNLMLQLQYDYNDDHTSADRYYHRLWVETYVRF